MRRALATLAVCLAAACTHHVDVELRPDFPSGVWRDAVLGGVRPTLRFERGTFADKRADTTRLATFRQDIHTYNLFGKRPVADALFDGLKVLIERVGHAWVPGDTGQVRVDLQLLEIEAVRDAACTECSHKDAWSSVRIKADFVDRTTGRLIYTHYYNGADHRSQALVGFMGMVRASLDASFITCINKVGADSGLVAALMQWAQVAGR